MKLLLAAIAVCLLVTSQVRAQDVSVTYDTFMRLDAAERLARFQTLTPINRAELLREQLARWRQLHAAELNAEEQQVLDDVAASIRPDNFTAARRDSSEIAAFMALQQRVSRAFVRPDIIEAFTLTGAPLPLK